MVGLSSGARSSSELEEGALNVIYQFLFERRLVP